MFRSTSERLNHRERVASHSTKEHANGRIDMIPADAEKPEEYYNTIKAQYLAIANEFSSVQNRLEELNSALKATMAHSEYKKLASERDLLAARYAELKPQIGEWKQYARAIAYESWSMVFYESAKRLLPKDALIKIENEVKTTLGRPPFDDIRKGEAEFTVDRRNNLTKKKNFKTKLERSRWKGNRNTTVFADDAGGYVPILSKRRTRT